MNRIFLISGLSILAGTTVFYIWDKSRACKDILTNADAFACEEE